MNSIAQIWQGLKNIVRLGNFSTPNGEKIYAEAIKHLDGDASPKDIAPDELGCAESVTTVIRDAGLIQPVIISTAELYKYFVTSENWVQVPTPLRGDVIISPTGLGGHNGITNGHTGIMADVYRIMSNSSATGMWKQNYNLDTWRARYQTLGGYPIFFFRRMGVN